MKVEKVMKAEGVKLGAGKRVWAFMGNPALVTGWDKVNVCQGGDGYDSTILGVNNPFGPNAPKVAN